MFSGMSNHSVDAKGRIVLPAKFREELGESFYIARGFGNPCIQAMSKEQFDVLSSRIMELPADKAMALQYSFTATAVEVAPNASGRVMLPQALREFAHPGLRNVFLCHLSEHNNTPELAYQASSEALKEAYGPAPEDVLFGNGLQDERPPRLCPLPRMTPSPMFVL